jgi:2-hydroxy-3-oxopropionate reductase
MTNLGFIGLGIMGKPMAGRLLTAGHPVYLHSRSPAPVEELAGRGGRACADAREVAEKSDIVFVMLPDTPDVEVVLFGNGGVSQGIGKGSIVVDMSSIAPLATRSFARRLAEMGVEMLDAPVSGGQIGAENGTLSIMVGGKTEIFAQVRPFFEHLGTSIVHIGPNGDGQICKVANQMVVALTIEAVGEALVLASKAGADPEKVQEALLGGFAQSRVLEVHGRRMIERNFEPGFRIELHQKDLNLALNTARELGMSIPGTALAQELFNAVRAAEGGALMDHSGMVHALERLAAHAVAERRNIG